jgi:uncharacterized membrane protein
MEILRWKTRIAVLWIFMAVAMSAHSIFSFMVPELVEEMWGMELGQGMMLFMALFWLIPLIMAVLSLTLKDSANRWANFVVGIVFTILNIVHFTEHLAPPSACQILITGSTIVVTGLIAWFAWRWPKQQT